MTTILPTDIQQFVQQHRLAMVYFKGDDCTVCASLGPRLLALAANQSVPMLTIDMPTNLHLAASEMVLSVPVVKLYVDGIEIAKEGAYLQLSKWQALVERWQDSWREL